MKAGTPIIAARFSTRENAILETDSPRVIRTGGFFSLPRTNFLGGAGLLFMTTKICTRCKETKDIGEFGFQKRNGKSYVRPHCKACDVDRANDYRKTPAGIASRKLEGQRRYKAQRMLYKSLKAQQKCLMCPENEPCCLDFHHLEPAKKRRILVDLVFTSFRRLKEEIAKCVCLCANCHRKHHAGKLELPPETKPLSREWIEACGEKARVACGLPATPRFQ